MTGSPIRSPSPSRPARSAVARRASARPAPAAAHPRSRGACPPATAWGGGSQLRGAGQRKCDPKGGSPPIRAVHVDLPAIRFDRPTRDGKAEANPVAGARPVDSIEAIEDALSVLDADARAGVDHLDGGPARFPANEDAHASSLWGVLDRVVDEVDEGTAHDDAI